MAKLLPFRGSDATIEPREPRLVGLDDDTADDVFAALSAGTARDILKRLYREPGTATDVAEAADTSLQNARYHLEKLQSAGLVEAVDTWYSSRGTEMTVYAPTNEPLVVAAGPEDQTSVLRSALGRLVGALGVLGIASLLVDRIARSGLAGVLPLGGTGGAATDGADMAEETPVAEFQVAEVTANATSTATPTPGADTATELATSTPLASPSPGTETVVAEATQTKTPTAVPTRTPEPTTVAAADPGLFDLAGGLPPGLAFFLGGLVVLAAVAGWWYWRSYRPLYG